MEHLSPTDSLNLAGLSPNAQAILQHLCSDPCHAFGLVVEFCETRGDCIEAVICPSCRRRFVIEDDEARELQRWTDQDGRLLACGVAWE